MLGKIFSIKSFIIWGNALVHWSQAVRIEAEPHISNGLALWGPKHLGPSARSSALLPHHFEGSRISPRPPHLPCQAQGYKRRSTPRTAAIPLELSSCNCKTPCFPDSW